MIAARAAAPGWIWLLSDDVEPRSDALDELLAAAERAGDAVVVASRVVRPDGRTHPDDLPWPEMFAKQRAADAARLRLLAVRAVRAGSLLVREGTAPPPAGPVADLAWSAGLLAGGGGYLAPRSVVVRSAPAARLGAAEAAARLRMLAAGRGFTPFERLWLAHALLQRARRR